MKTWLNKMQLPQSKQNVMVQVEIHANVKVPSSAYKKIHVIFIITRYQECLLTETNKYKFNNYYKCKFYFPFTNTQFLENEKHLRFYKITRGSFTLSK